MIPFSGGRISTFTRFLKPDTFNRQINGKTLQDNKRLAGNAENPAPIRE
jgi:hypothetical protein